jgi:hypothetical protein
MLDQLASCGVLTLLLKLHLRSVVGRVLACCGEVGCSLLWGSGL